MVADAIEGGTLQEIDLGLGAEEYKEKLANQTRETLYVTLHSSAPRHFRGVARYWGSKALKRFPAAEALARRCVARLHPLRERVRQDGSSQTLTWLCARVLHLLWSRNEVFFYELSNPNQKLLEPEGVFLKPIDLSTLAAAAVQNADDEATLGYLLRCAHRLQT
jgi:hypothetical protein